MKVTTLFLIGFSGSGKSKLGKQLAEKLDYTFFDLDALIEQNIGLSINEIFERHGETKFREMEQNALTKMIFNSHSVVACGGGTPCFHNNIDFMLQQGTVIYLKVTEDNLEKRLLSNLSNRPLLKNEMGNKLDGKIKIILEERREYYERATITIENNTTESEALDKIISAL